ncbi:MAG TPA: amidohydrolase family protein [Nocardioides sp.]|uniref:amidohydrolase family protein n=1 Tax=Nocardioides sp. TaxID=35761 RepID=UPI002F41C307
MDDALDLASHLLDLVDHHCHAILTTDLDRTAFEALMNEAGGASTLGTTLFDSMLGWAIRRHCAPVLDLEPLVTAEEYLARRAELGGAEASRRLMAAAGIGTLLVDTGIGSPAADTELTPMAELAALSGGTAREVVRLERLAEDVLAAGTDDFVGEMEERLRSARAGGAVAAKSIAAYRGGLDLSALKPPADVVASGLTETDHVRLAHPVVSSWLAHSAIEAGLPLQVHVGYGDRDLSLAAADPLWLTSFLRATEEHGVPVLLLHNWPYHRHAAYLAQVFDHVFADLGLATHNTGALSTGVLRETLELVPFGKLLFSSDAYGLAELYLLGALLFRTSLSTVLGELVAAGETTEADTAYVAGLVARENARRVYAL